MRKGYRQSSLELFQGQQWGNSWDRGGAHIYIHGPSRAHRYHLELKWTEVLLLTCVLTNTLWCRAPAALCGRLLSDSVCVDLERILTGLLFRASMLDCRSCLPWRTLTCRRWCSCCRRRHETRLGLSLSSGPCSVSSMFSVRNWNNQHLFCVEEFKQPGFVWVKCLCMNRHEYAYCYNFYE